MVPAASQPASIYAEIEGVEGSVDLRGREGTIEVLRVDLSLGQTDGANRSGRRGAGAEGNPLVFGKRVDASTVPLLEALRTGTAFPIVRFTYYEINRTGTEVEFYAVTLEDVRVTSFVHTYDARDGADRVPTEMVGLTYSDISFRWADGGTETTYGSVRGVTTRR